MTSFEADRDATPAFDLEQESGWPDCQSGWCDAFKRGGGPKGAPPTIPPIIIKRPRIAPAEAPIDPHTTLPGPPVAPPPAPPISIGEGAACARALWQGRVSIGSGLV